MSNDLPTIVTLAGLQPRTPASIQAEFLADVAVMSPGYTANLPGALIEDISSTDVGAIVQMDQARVEFFNSLTPLGANEFLLNQIGQQTGVPIGAATNTSVQLIFSGTPGFPIATGFTVSDGTNQYIVQDGGIVGSGGASDLVFAVSPNPGSWAVPANSVTTLVTSVPGTVTLSVTNPATGTPGIATGETQGAYRARVLQAQLAASQGMSRYMKTLLGEVPGVQQRLISVRQSGSNWEVLCGGGDQYQVANAIWQALFDINTLVGSTIHVTGITNANPGVVTTDLNHGYTSGRVVNIAGVVGMSGVNNTPLTITVITEKTFSIGIDTTSSGAYTSGGVVTPNLRNVAVSINDYPDSYLITFVNPPQQTVTMTVTWNTNSPNFVSPVAVAQLGAPALVNYINGIPVGAPMNIFEMNTVFQVAIVSLLDPNLLTRLVFSISINGVGTSPSSGTGIVAGDPESYFFAVTSGISIVQG